MKKKLLTFCAAVFVVVAFLLDVAMMGVVLLIAMGAQ